MPMSQVGLETNTWHKTGAQALAASRRRLTVSPALASASRMIFARASMACRIETLRSCPRPYHLTVRSVHQLIVPKDHRSKKRTVAHRLRRAHWLLSSQNKSLSQRVHPLFENRKITMVFTVCKVGKGQGKQRKNTAWPVQSKLAPSVLGDTFGFWWRLYKHDIQGYGYRQRQGSGWRWVRHIHRLSA